MNEFLRIMNQNTDSAPTDLQVFTYNSAEVRTVMQDGEPWFVLRDVCNILGMDKSAASTQWAAKLDEDELHKMKVVDSRGHMQDTYIINEPGLYNVIMRSNKPEAKEFKRWVTHEVLPAIRKTGSYLPQLTPNQLLLKIAQANVELEIRQAALEERVETQEKLILETGSKLEAAAKAFVAPAGDSWIADMKDRISAVGEAQNKIYSRVAGQLYDELERDACVDISSRRTRCRARMKKQGATYKERQNVTKLDIISKDKQLRVAFESIVRRHQAALVQ